MIGLLIDLFGMFGKRKEKLLANAVIRVKHTGFVDSLRAHLKRQNPGISDTELQRVLPLTRPLVGDLVTAYAADGVNASHYVGEGFLADNKVTLDEVHQAAFANTRAQVVRQISQAELDNFIGVQSSVPGAAACLVLFPEYWQSWEKKLGAPLVAVVPGRDFVAFRAIPPAGPAREQALIRALVMRNAAMSAFEESGNHALSEFAFHVRAGKFEVASQLGDYDAETRALLDSPEGRAVARQCGVEMPEPTG
jgi:hypothetical protein